MVESETEIICCENGFKLPKTLLHPECLAIDIPQNDFFYGRLGQRCMEFVRSMPAERPDCNLGPREQVLCIKYIVNMILFPVLNFLTHFERETRYFMVILWDFATFYQKD